MEEQERLTMEFVKSLMDKSYTLVWVDYNDNLDNCRDTIQKCLEERSCESLWEKVDEWYGDAEWEAVREIVSKLKDECIRFHDFGEEEVDKFFQEHEDEIREEIYDRNDSDTQIASAKIPLSRMISPQLYWVMTGDDFTLDLNNPEQPKILCVGNNPDRQNIYSAALGLYNSRIVKLVNKKGQLKSSIIIDELPTIYFRGIDNLIATARSNKVAVCLGFQDFSQLARDYGDKEAKVIQNTVGNIFSGQVVGETAKNLSERFGKILQQRQSISINRQDTSTSINTQLDSLIPASKIANLSQGTFVGSVADNFGEEIEQKIFHARIIVDNEKVAAETKAYKKIPVINEFKDADGNDIMQQQIDRNYSQIKADVLQIIEDEMERIKNNPDLQHLIPKEDSDKKEE